MATKLGAPVDVQIELTQACNWRCRHCYNYWRSSGRAVGSSRHLSKEDLLRIVQELSTNCVPSITITGGEPFMRRREVFELLEMVEGAGIHASINTNLSLMRTKDVVRIASEHKGVSILFSLLSADAELHERLAGVPSGTQDKVVKTAAHAIQRGLHVSLNMVLVRENLRTMEATARLAESLGVSAFCATKALPNAHAPDGTYLLTPEEVHWSLVELMRVEKLLNIPVDILGCYPRCLFIDTPAYRRFSHRTCVAGYTTVTIGADGNVRPCSHMGTSYGNILREPLSNIWQKMEGWREAEFVPLQCRGCPVVAACRGGCRVNTLSNGQQNLDLYAVPQRLRCLPKEHFTQQHMPNKADTMLGGVVVGTQVKFRDESFELWFIGQTPWPSSSSITVLLRS